MANRQTTHYILTGMAAASDAAAVFGGSASVRAGLAMAAVLLRGVADAVTAQGEEAVKKAIHEMAATPAVRANLDRTKTAVEVALGARPDAPVDVGTADTDPAPADK